jgi:hypothetical protein
MLNINLRSLISRRIITRRRKLYPWGISCSRKPTDEIQKIDEVKKRIVEAQRQF